MPICPKPASNACIPWTCSHCANESENSGFPNASSIAVFCTRSFIGALRSMVNSFFKKIAFWIFIQVPFLQLDFYFFVLRIPEWLKLVRTYWYSGVNKILACFGSTDSSSIVRVTSGSEPEPMTSPSIPRFIYANRSLNGPFIHLSE